MHFELNISTWGNIFVNSKILSYCRINNFGYDIWPCYWPQITKLTQKWIPHITFSGKSDITRDFMNSIKWFNFFLTMAAILAAILDFSNCSRISSWYPPDIRSRDTKYIKSSEKKTFTVNAGYRCLAAWLIGMCWLISLYCWFVTARIPTPSMC